MMSRFAAIGIAGFAVASCAAIPVLPAQQVVTMSAMQTAMATAIRLSEKLGPQSGPALHPTAERIEIRHAPIELIREIPGAAMARVAVTERNPAMGIRFNFRNDRPWQSNDPHHEAIKVHEAAHGLQRPHLISGACEERQAYLIQAAYLHERSEPELALEMAAQADAQPCNTF